MTASAPTFGSVSQDVAGTNSTVAPTLISAGSAAGDASLAAAISDLADAVETAVSSAAVTLSGLSRAVAQAAQDYSGTDANIARAARFR